MITNLSIEYKRGFILDESKLRQIESIIKQRFSSVCPNLVVTIEMKTTETIYSATTIDDFINQTNDVSSKISRVELTGKDSDYRKDFKVNIQFQKNESVKFNVIGTNKDIVSLLFKDLDDYLKDEVAFFSLRHLKTAPNFIVAVFSGLNLCCSEIGCLSPKFLTRALVKLTSTWSSISAIANNTSLPG